MKEQILGTGLSGLVGSRVVELNPDLNFVNASLENGVNILDKKQLKQFFKNNPEASAIIHFAAFTDTTAAWNQKGDKNGLCYQLNVNGTQNIVDLCKEYHKHLIHISTDFVFDGTKKTEYTEEDTPHPLDWYGETKYLAEKLIIDSGLPASIVRIAFPYRALSNTKVDFVRKILNKLQNNEPVTMFTDQKTTPTFIDDIGLGLRFFMDKKPLGIYHLVGSISQSPYDTAKNIAQVFDLNADLIRSSSLEDYLRTPNARPYAKNLSLSNQKFSSESGFSPRNITAGLQELKRQLSLLASPQN